MTSLVSVHPETGSVALLVIFSVSLLPLAAPDATLPKLVKPAPVCRNRR
jgi:hypothetical protein